MTNAIPETIDVTEFIESGEYYPDSCEGRLNKLVKVRPRKLDQTYENELQKKMSQWRNEYNDWLKKNKRDTVFFKVENLVGKTTYQYSSFMTNQPLDVYRTDTDIELNGIKNFRFFIEIDNAGNIFSDYQDNGWVYDNCDSINSVVQNIYGTKDK